MKYFFQNSERDWYDYGASRLNSGTQSGPEVTEREVECLNMMTTELFKCGSKSQKKKIPLKKQSWAIPASTLSLFCDYIYFVLHSKEEK